MIIAIIIALFSSDLSGKWSVETKIDQSLHGINYMIDFDFLKKNSFEIVTTDYTTDLATVITGRFETKHDTIIFHGKRIRTWLHNNNIISQPGNSLLYVKYKFQNGYLMIAFDGVNYQKFIYGDPLGEHHEGAGRLY